MTLNEMYDKALKHYGKFAQIKKAQEECYELHVALDNTDNRQAILEEVADVLNMIESISLIFGFSQEEIEQEMERKMQRTMERIEKEKEGDEY